MRLTGHRSQVSAEATTQRPARPADAERCCSKSELWSTWLEWSAGYFAEESHRTKRSFPSGLFDVQELDIASAQDFRFALKLVWSTSSKPVRMTPKVLMDPEHVEPVQSDTEA